MASNIVQMNTRIPKGLKEKIEQRVKEKEGTSLNTVVTELLVKGLAIDQQNLEGIPMEVLIAELISRSNGMLITFSEPHKNLG